MSTQIEWEKEVWRPVLGFDDYYATGDGKIRGPMGKTMKQMEMPTGHLYIFCNRGRGRQRKLFVHRAVLLAFKGLPRRGEETRHLDGNPSNNALDNLAWGTRLENAQDRKRHGRCPTGFDHWSAKLCPEDIPVIRSLQGTQSSRVVAKVFNVSHTTILEIWRNHRWEDY